MQQILRAAFSILAVAICLVACGCSNSGKRKEIRLAYVNWSDATALTYLARKTSTPSSDPVSNRIIQMPPSFSGNGNSIAASLKI